MIHTQCRFDKLAFRNNTNRDNSPFIGISEGRRGNGMVGEPHGFKGEVILEPFLASCYPLKAGCAVVVMIGVIPPCCPLCRTVCGRGLSAWYLAVCRRLRLAFPFLARFMAAPVPPDDKYFMVNDVPVSVVLFAVKG